MKSIFRRRPSPGLIVAIIALLVALGGTAIAANTIRSGDIVNGEVKTADLADGAVNSAKVGDRTLTGDDLHTRTVGTAELAKLPAVDAYRISDLPVNPNTPNIVPLDGESFDTADMHSGSGFLVRARVAGIYRVTAHVSWVGNASATLPDGTECEVILGRGTPLDPEPPIGSSKEECSAGHAIEVNRAVRMNGRETLFMVITQDSNAAFTLDAAQDPVYLDLTWVGPAS
jgi:hypothetical protein